MHISSKTDPPADARSNTPESSTAQATRAGSLTAGSLEITVSGGDPRTFRLRGDLDCVTAPTLRDALLWGPRPVDGLVMVDLGGVMFLSASSLTVLLEAHQRISGDGGRLLLIHPTRMQRRILEIVALDQVLLIEER